MTAFAASLAPDDHVLEAETDLKVDGQLVYAIGDVHGRYDLLKDLLAEIARDSARRAEGRRPVLVFCGDYVDRGPESAQVLDALVWLTRRPDFELHLLMGNHEQGMLGFLDRPEWGEPWLQFGGVETLASYGVALPEEEFGPSFLVQARDDLLDRMPAAHLRLLQGLKAMAVVGDYAFVHAGVRPGAALADQAERDLYWIRGEFIESEGPHEKVIVHGHTWIDDKPQLHPHRLGIDTGAYATGVLSALRLEDGKRAVIQVRGAKPAEALYD
jgi:serine/threonine protein phosphatase 1